MEDSKQQNADVVDKNRFSFHALIFLGVLLFALTVTLAWYADSFPYQRQPKAGRPIIQFVVLSWIASAVSLVAIFVGLTVSRSQRLLSGSIVLFAIAFRLILVFSNPILEVDYYRYLWDGIAANQGVTPYKFAPVEILCGPADDPQLIGLQQYITDHPSAKKIVARVHFENFTTLYPPVSQVFFRLTTQLIPDDASVETHIVAIKLMLVLFDVGVILCLVWLISVLGKHPAWLIAYAWSPLVLKEISNGGHLDSIAIFFFTAGIAVFLWIVNRIQLPDKDSGNQPSGTDGSRAPIWVSAASGGLIALGIGAKLFPIVLVPALGVFMLVKRQLTHAIVFGISCLVISALALFPMIVHEKSPPEDVQAAIEIATGKAAPDSETNDGLAVFITGWRMNDAIFSFVYQNVEYDWGGKSPAWYVFVPNKKRIEWSQNLANEKFANGNAAYFVARLVTVALFALFYLWILFKIWKTESASDMANVLFLIMGVFFFLQPTQNPWYWLWAMPFVCFAKNRGWLFVSMALFVYYSRFWFQEKAETYRFWDVDYVGFDFYDHCVVWIEFLTIIGVLIAFRIFRPRIAADVNE